MRLVLSATTHVKLLIGSTGATRGAGPMIAASGGSDILGDPSGPFRDFTPQTIVFGGSWLVR